MRVEHKPFLKARSAEDSLVEKLRRYIWDAQYWVEVARLDGGPDTTKYEAARQQEITFILCLGERLMNTRMGFDSGEKWHGELCPEVAIMEGNKYLDKIRREGTPEKES